MSDFLTEMSEASLVRARVAKQGAAVTGLDARVTSARPALQVDFSPPGFDMIAEAKLASPSAGELVAGGSSKVLDLATTYARNGASVLSILTEESRFGGSLEDLETVSGALDTPVLRKDFLVDPVQVLEARAAGASGVLLIARMLPGSLLHEMTDLVLDLGMFALVEVFDRSDLETAVPVFDRNVLVGVNCRDLATLEVDKARFEHLAPHLPAHLPAVAESGIHSGEDVAHVAHLGYRLALVGTSLVSAPDPGALLADMVDAGRSHLETTS